MRKLAGYVALTLAVLMMVSSAAMAWDFNDHVKVAPNKKGDVLIFPVYAAISQWDTKFTIINTAADRSVVAKVVFRSAIFTQELLDFLIYLSPTDEWTGTVRYNATLNRVEVFSDDDSCLASAGTWASPATPFIAPLATPGCTSDMNTIGYVEVFEAAHSVLNATYPPVGSATAVSLNQAPASKSAIANAYANWTSNGPPAVQNVVLAMDNINVLTGIEEIRNTTINQKAALTATTLRDYGATEIGQTPLTVVNETFFGDISAANTIGEVEATLAKNDLAMYYSDKNLTLHFLTFPTKLAYRSITNKPTCTTYNAFTSPYFAQRSVNGCITYGAVNYDRSENSSIATNIVSPATTASLCSEVNWLSNFAFAEGWARYTFTPGAAATTFDVASTVAPYNGSPDGNYTGAPVLGTVLHLGSTADGYIMVPAAHTDGTVKRTAITVGEVAGLVVTLPVIAANGSVNYWYYQYQDEANLGTGYDANLPPAANQTRLVRPDGDHPINPLIP